MREDTDPRGRQPGEFAGLVTAGVADECEIARCKQVEEVLNEIEAGSTHVARQQGRPGSHLRDNHSKVMTELEN